MRFLLWRFGISTRVAVVVLVATLLVTGGAIAFWSGAGSGTTQTRLDDPKPIVMVPGTPSDQIFPGYSANVLAEASNPNPYSVHVDALALDTAVGDGGFDVDAQHGGCALSALTFTTQDNGGAGWDVPPRAADADGVLSIPMIDSLAMDVGAADACQGATFTVYLLETD